MTDWLVQQLPDVLSRDPLVSAFARTAQELGDTVDARIASVESELDIAFAGPRMLAYLGSWLGLDLDPTDDAEVQRALLRATGRTLTRRGTRLGLAELLASMTGGPVEVVDGGGVYGPTDEIPQPDRTVRIRVAQFGPLGRERLTGIVEGELPIGTRLDLDDLRGATA